LTLFALWVPGKFSLTNAMLSNLRAAGRYQGTARAKGWKPGPGYDLFAAETQAIRLAVKAAMVRSPIPFVFPALTSLDFRVFGHRRHDPDAWYLLAKAATDGLADAGLFANDRHSVGHTSGRVLQSEDEERKAREVAAMIPTAALPPSGVPGVLIWLLPETVDE
jgi:hypothetical protein